VDEEDLAETINKIGYPIVLKPLDGNHEKELQSLIGKMLFLVCLLSKEYSIIVEKFITGFDFRILVIDNKLVAAAKRVCARNRKWSKSIEELIATENLDLEEVMDTKMC
jgi:cyanophycin synthetase